MLGIDSAGSCINGERLARPIRAVTWHLTAMRDVKRTEIRGGWGSVVGRRLPAAPRGRFQ